MQLDPESDEAKKQAKADRRRRAEKFMTVGTGKALCVSCGYEYESKRGDPEYPITPGTLFTVCTGLPALVAAVVAVQAHICKLSVLYRHIETLCVASNAV